MRHCIDFGGSGRTTGSLFYEMRLLVKPILFFGTIENVRYSEPITKSLLARELESNSVPCGDNGFEIVGLSQMLCCNPQSFGQ